MYFALLFSFENGLALKNLTELRTSFGNDVLRQINDDDVISNFIEMKFAYRQKPVGIN